MSTDHKLAAILFADIAGYTAMMQKNEQDALELLNRFKEALEEITPKHQGRIVQYFGDGCLLSFDSSSNSVDCAIALQKAFSETPSVPVRIGMHLGDVIFKNDNVFGDGVNIASRIESLGIPGAILMSKTIRDQIKNQKEFLLVSLGSFDFKNVEEKMEVFALANPGFVVPKREEMQGKLKDQKNKGILKWTIAIAFIMVLSFALWYFLSQKKTENAIIEKSIAVLPFVNISNDQQQEYFSDGLSEELLNLLAKIPELKVIGRTSSFSFKGKNEDLRSIAQKLGVAHILEGSVRKDGNKIRVTAQLIKATDGSHMWSETYDRDLNGIFQLQDEIANAVVQELKLKLLNVPSANVSGTRNIEAYNLILQGNYFYDKLDKESVAKAVEFYYKALAIDSTDARAWVCLTNAISRQSWQNYIDQTTGYEKARQTALKAIALDPTYAPGFSELADIKQYYDFDWKGAEKDYQTALSIDPSNADILNSFGDVLHAQGHYREAEQYHRKALELNPLKPLLYMSLASDLSYPGKFAEAIPYYKKVLELDPQYQRARLYIGRNYIMMGKPELALEEIQKENMEVFKNFGLAIIYFSLNRKKEADEKLSEFIEKYQDHWRYLIAQLYAFRNEKEEAFKWLESAYDHRDSWLWWIKNDPWLKNIQHDLRYKTFMKKMNLPLD